MPAAGRAHTALGLGLCLCLCPRVWGDCSDFAAAFQQLYEDSERMGGMVLRIQKQGREPFVVVAGQLSKSLNASMASGTLFEVASVAKTWVSALILNKAHEYQMPLATTAKSILGENLPDGLLVIDGSDRTDQITLEQLLTHKSGLPHFWSDGPKRGAEAWYALDGRPAPSTNPYWSTLKDFPITYYGYLGIAIPFLEGLEPRIVGPSEVLAMIPKYDPKAVEAYHYSDTGYIVLGLVAEVLYGKSLDDAIRTDLLPALGLASPRSFMRYDVAAGRDRAPPGSERYGNLSHRYFREPDIAQALQTDNVWYDTTMTDPRFPVATLVSSNFNSADWASGGLVTSADELAAFFAGLAESTASPWREIWGEMVASMDPTDPDDYGYGISRRHSGDGRYWYGHSGDGGAIMFYDVVDKIVVTGTSNSQGVYLQDFVYGNGDRLRACAASMEGGTPAPGPAPMTCGEVKALYKMHECCGNPSRRVELSLQGRRMTAAAGGAEGSSRRALVGEVEGALRRALAEGGPQAARDLAVKLESLMAKHM